MSYPPMPFGYPSPAASGPDPRKKQQVDELLAQVPSCRPLNVDRTLLELPVQTREGRLLAVQISLPQRFPDEPPVLVVKQLFRHPVIDGNGRLQLPALQFWHPGHRLAAVVRDAQSALIGQPAPAGTSGKVHYAAGRPRPRPVNGTMPVASHITAALQELSIEQLGRCMIDAAAYQQLVKKLLQSSQVSCVNEELKKSNRDVAQSNLEREKEMQEIGNHIAIIKSSEYADAKGLYHEQLQRQQEVVGRLSIPVLREQLQQAAKKVDEESEDYSRRFLSGDISAETFTDEFCKLRMTYYARELKAQAAGQLQ